MRGKTKIGSILMNSSTSMPFITSRQLQLTSVILVSILSRSQDLMIGPIAEPRISGVTDQTQIKSYLLSCICSYKEFSIIIIEFR
jgi:hypothetical protein